MSLGRMINETSIESSRRRTTGIHRKNKADNAMDNKFRCDSNSRVTFASSDAHDGPRTDISFLLLNMNQSFVHLGPRNATKNYPQGIILFVIKFKMLYLINVLLD